MCKFIAKTQLTNRFIIVVKNNLTGFAVAQKGFQESCVGAERLFICMTIKKEADHCQDNHESSQTVDLLGSCIVAF